MLTGRAISVATVIVTLSATASSIVLAVLSTSGHLNNTNRLDAIMVILSVTLLVFLTDRFLILASLHRKIDSLQSAIQTPPVLRPWSKVTPFDTFVSGATDLLIIGLTKAGSLTGGTERLARIIRSGCKVRLAVMDGEEPHLYLLTARCTTHSAERLMGDYHVFVETIRTLRAELSAAENNRLQIRKYPFIPSAGIVLAYRGQSATAQVYFYPYRVDPDDRPSVELTSSDEGPWLSFFREHYERLWRDLSDHVLDVV